MSTKAFTRVEGDNSKFLKGRVLNDPSVFSACFFKNNFSHCNPSLRVSSFFFWGGGQNPHASSVTIKVKNIP